MSGFELGEVVVLVDLKSHGNGKSVEKAHLRIGGFYRLSWVGYARSYDGTMHSAVKIEGDPNCELGAYAASRFRKLPRADADFTATIRACRPVKVGEVA